MKTKFRVKQPWFNYFFSILLIAFHIQLGLSRPPSIANNRHVQNADDELRDSDERNDFPSGRIRLLLPQKQRHSQVTQDQPSGGDARHFYDLRNVGPSEIHYGSMDRRHKEGLLKNNDTLVLYPGDEDFIRLRDVILDDVDETQSDVMEDQELPPLAGDRNLVRKRRHHPESQKPHRRHSNNKRRKQHRLVLKARNNHLLEEEDALKGPHRFLIKSDSPGYVITSASEVKKDWCRTIPLRQKVSEPHCRSRVVQNNFCYGQCNSFFIPHTGRTDKKVAFQSCAFCKPFKQHWGNVTLNCPGRNPPKMEKTVLFVETCRCITEVLQ